METNCVSASLSFQKTRVFLRFMVFFCKFCQILIGKKIIINCLSIQRRRYPLLSYIPKLKELRQQFLEERQQWPFQRRMIARIPT